MKTSRYISVLAAACVLGFANSCDITSIDSGNTKYGVGDAVVGFSADTYTFKESAGLVSIPLQITGSPKVYPFTFDIKTDNVVSDIELKDLVYFTQTEGFKYNGAITDGKETPANVFIEFKITDDFVINENRSFQISLTNVEGAELGEIATATIIVKDNDNNPYEKLWGDWVLTAKDYDGAAASFPVSINGGWSLEEEDANADKKLVCWGFLGYKEMVASVTPAHFPEWYIDIDIDAETLEIEVGTLMVASGLFNFGTGASGYTVVSGSKNITAGTPVSEKEKISGTWSKDFNTITFDPNYAFAGLVYADGGYLGVWDWFSQIVLTRKK